jgi:CRISPR type III-A-associated RAMP protein Csm5
MIKQIKLEALTSVHIGSGQKFPMNIEVLFDGENLGIISLDKVVKKIGINNISKLTAAIENNEDTLEFLKRFGITDITNVSVRTMGVWGSNISQKRDLKEQLMSARGFPLLPGSSIKGAIRTAILSDMINNNDSIALNVISQQRRKTPSNRWKLRDFQNIERTIANKYFNGTDRPNANKDIMRFIQITDAEFEYKTIATNVKILNLQRNGWDFKNRGDQLTEAIGPGSETNFRIKTDETLLNKNIEKNTISRNIDTSFLLSIENIFYIINNHTEALLKREIENWEEEIEQTGISNSATEALNNYLDNLKEIKEQLLELNTKKECILRIGGNTGWDFITGAWIKNNNKLLTDNEWENLYKQLNKGRNVDMYPKTRKLAEDGDRFGFVKMEII